MQSEPHLDAQCTQTGRIKVSIRSMSVYHHLNLFLNTANVEITQQIIFFTLHSILCGDVLQHVFAIYERCKKDSKEEFFPTTISFSHERPF